MGAMENAGCVTFRDEYLPRSRQDRSFYEFRAEVILHEMAHMWFGDLVTMKWWDDLWLNESFAEWACYHAAVNATEFTEAWTGFTNARKNWAYRQDQLPSTHPIAADNYDLQAVEVNFDGITYAKGASVLKQLVAWVGLEKFLDGLRGYFQDFEFGNSEFKDLLMALEKSVGRELESWAQRVAADLRRQHPGRRSSSWTTTAATRRSRSSRPRHADYPTLRRHRLGIGLYDKVGRPPGPAYVARDRRRGRADRGRASWSARSSPTCCCSTTATSPTPRSGSTSARWTTLVTSIETIDDSLARALCWGAAWDMTRDAEMSATDFVTLVLSGHRVGDRRVRRQPAPGVRRRWRSPSTPPRRTAPSCARRGRRGCASCSMTAEPGGDHQLSFARAYAAAAHSDEALDDLEGLLDGSLGHRRARGRHRPALDAALRAGQERPRGRRPDRRGAGPRQHDLRQGARRRGPRAAPDRRGEGRGVGDRDGARRRPERDPAQHRARLPGLRPGRGARAVRREVPRRGRDDVGGEGHPARLDRAGVHLPQARWPARSSSTGSTPGWRPPRPTRPPSATSARAATTSPARCAPRPRTRRA